MNNEFWFLSLFVSRESQDVRKLDSFDDFKCLIHYFIYTNIFDRNRHTVDVSLAEFLVLCHQRVVYETVLIIQTFYLRCNLLYRLRHLLFEDFVVMLYFAFF